MNLFKKIRRFVTGENDVPPESADDAVSARRERMVTNQLEERGIRDPRVLEAMRNIPRHRFVQVADPERAYQDKPLPIGENQTISQPYMVALMTETLQVRSTDDILEIGTGSGYQTAILAHLGHHVFTVERHESLLEEALDTLASLEYNNVTGHVGDGTLGWEEHAPYDRILVTAGAPEVPETLKMQLSEDGGILVLPVGGTAGQQLVRIKRNRDTFERDELGRCVFVKLIGEEGW